MCYILGIVVDHGRLTSKITKTDALKVGNIEKIMADRFYGMFHLMFHGSRIHIKIQGFHRSQITKGNEGIVREGKNMTEKRMATIVLR